MPNQAATERSSQQDLNAEYRDAFERWAVQVVQLHLAHESAARDAFMPQRRINADRAESAYRVARNRFAAKLMQSTTVSDRLSRFPV